MAAVRLVDHVAAAGVAIAAITAQSATYPGPTAAVVLTGQHADIGAGSVAAVRLTSQSATAFRAATIAAPAGVAAAAGGTWQPLAIRSSNGTGAWS